MIGEVAALTAAFFWASSSVVYSFLGRKIPPLSLNILKGLIAICLILLTLTFTKTSNNFTSESWRFWLLALSGVIGIGLGDTAYFFALNNLGARKTLVLENLSPPLGAILAFVVIGEVISIGAWSGILITLLGIILVIGEQTTAQPNFKHNIYQGSLWAIAAAIAQAVGAVMSRIALLDSDISSLSSSLIRIGAGVTIAIALSFLPCFKKERIFQRKLLSLPPKTFGIIFIAAMGSTYFGIWLQQISLKYAPTGVAQTLLATSPLFVIPISLVLGEKVSLRAITGATIALGGISLLFVLN